MPRPTALTHSAALIASFWTVTGVASPAYPPTIQAELGLATAPNCTLCHRDDVGGTGTVVTPFGRLMMNHFGLTGGSNVAALRAALEGDDAEHLDVDGDGIPDIAELRAGTDVNVGASGVAPESDIPLPETGCSLATRFHQRGIGLFAFASFGLLLRRRSFRGKRPRERR